MPTSSLAVDADPQTDAASGRAHVARLLPARLADRAGWAADLHASITALGLPLNDANACAAIAVIEQESLYSTNPSVPGLARIAWSEIEARRVRAGVPRWLLDSALAWRSGDGRSYKARIDAARTERDLSDAFEDLTGKVPLGRFFLSGRNPVRTGGPMQVGVAFAEAHARERPYPGRTDGGLRNAIFTRRGGIYFGVAHLLDYPAPYSGMLYRFADFNAGRYASRNVAFQDAVALISGVDLERDGDLLQYRDGTLVETPGATEVALRWIAAPLGMSLTTIRADLMKEKTAAFETSALYQRVRALAEQAAGRALPHAAMPRIDLKSPKLQRRLTTEWFARRVDSRYQQCLARG
jgi:hypothetical protein